MNDLKDLHVVVHADGLAKYRLLRSLGGGAGASTIVAVASPIGQLTMLSFAESVLIGMGKDPWVWSAKRSGVALAEAWLRQGGVEDVIVADSQLLGSKLAHEAARWLSAQGVAAWFTFATTTPQAPSEEIERIITVLRDDLGAEWTSWDSFAERFPPIKNPGPQPDPHRLPRLPRVDGIGFIEVCRQLLEPDELEIVEAQFDAYLDEICHEMQTLRQPSKKRELTRRLAQRLQATPTTEHLVLFVRAMQVAGLDEGWFVRVRTPVLLGAAETPRIGQAVADEWWHRLLAYRDPDPGAIAAMFFAGVDIAAMTQIRLCDVAVGTAGEVRLSCGSEEVIVPVPQAVYVRCLYEFQRVRGANDDSRLITTHRKEEVTRRYATACLRTPEADIGLTLTTERTPRSQREPQTELLRYGITIEKLMKAG